MCDGLIIAEVGWWKMEFDGWAGMMRRQVLKAAYRSAASSSLLLSAEKADVA